MQIILLQEIYIANLDLEKLAKEKTTMAVFIIAVTGRMQ